jgi:hypothetical protein
LSTFSQLAVLLLLSLPVLAGAITILLTGAHNSLMGLPMKKINEFLK